MRMGIKMKAFSSSSCVPLAVGRPMTEELLFRSWPVDDLVTGVGLKYGSFLCLSGSRSHATGRELLVRRSELSKLTPWNTRSRIHTATSAQHPITFTWKGKGENERKEKSSAALLLVPFPSSEKRFSSFLLHKSIFCPLFFGYLSML